MIKDTEFMAETEPGKNEFHPQPATNQQHPVNQGEKQAMIKFITSKLAYICDNDSDRINNELSGVCTGISHPEELNKLTLAELRNINVLIEEKKEQIRIEIQTNVEHAVKYFTELQRRGYKI